MQKINERKIKLLFKEEIKSLLKLDISVHLFSKKREGSQHFKIPGLVLLDNVAQVVGFQLVSLTLGSRFWQKVKEVIRFMLFILRKGI